MTRKTALAAAITVMLYTRPAIVAAEGIRLTPFRSGNVEGHYAIFAEEEAAERLASGFWVDHPNRLAELDEAIAEAAEKEAKQDKKEQDEQDAKDEKEKQDEEVAQKAPESTATASEPETAPKAAEPEKEPESAAEAKESTQEAKADESKPKDGEKVDGAKVPTDKKAKK